MTSSAKDRAGGSRSRRAPAVAGVLTLLALVATASFPLGLPEAFSEAFSEVRTGVASPEPPLDSDGCPTAWVDNWHFDGPPGPLVPSEGATSVTLCELVTSQHQDPLLPPERDLGVPRTLTVGVSSMIAILNALPTRAEDDARIRAREKAAGRPVPVDLPRGCNAVGFLTELSFSVRYAGGPPAVVRLDRNCGTASHAGRVRLLDGGRSVVHGGQPVDAFLTLYREQLASTAGAVEPPACAAAPLARRMENRTYADAPRDDIRRNRGRAVHLPTRLVVVTACRYVRDGDRMRLRGRRTLRDGLEPVRALLNDAAAVRVRTNGGGEEVINNTECGRSGPGTTGVRDLDVVWAADLTGAVAEVRVWRSPCRAVVADLGGRLAPKALLDTLDSWLNR
ncbi:hypothetical protein [Microtetraspora fusca]|uniref:hypothetical protein n=1 Tax=Microtetraspora fusca TaxID=1997 RepID=UPI000AD8BD29|nr:hypothetical protein [Microtetraspora fusca]